MIDRRVRQSALARILAENPDRDDALQIVDLAICFILAGLVVGVMLICYH